MLGEQHVRHCLACVQAMIVSMLRSCPSIHILGTSGHSRQRQELLPFKLRRLSDPFEADTVHSCWIPCPVLLNMCNVLCCMDE